MGDRIVAESEEAARFVERLRHLLKVPKAEVDAMVKNFKTQRIRKRNKRERQSKTKTASSKT